MGSQSESVTNPEKTPGCTCSGSPAGKFSDQTNLAPAQAHPPSPAPPSLQTASSPQIGSAHQR
eukprot:1160158-Pelagomonas_calceolata.AAC.7